ERVLLAADVDAVRGPHAMFVRVEADAGRPYDVQDCEVARTVQRDDAAFGRDAQRRVDGVGRRDRSLYELFDRKGRLGDRCLAGLQELIEVGHGASTDRTDGTSVGIPSAGAERATVPALLVLRGAFFLQR